MASQPNISSGLGKMSGSQAEAAHLFLPSFLRGGGGGALFGTVKAAVH